MFTQYQYMGTLLHNMMLFGVWTTIVYMRLHSLHVVPPMKAIFLQEEKKMDTSDMAQVVKLML